MTPSDRSRFLRRALLSNALFSAISGTCFVIASVPISEWIGLHQPPLVVGVGISLLVFAGLLVATSRRKIVNTTEAWIAVILDLGWVVGSGVVVVAGVLSTSGNWAIVIVADVVFMFAVLQYLGLRHLRQVTTA